MPSNYHHPSDVLSFASGQSGEFALVTVQDVTGGAMRAPGALMCVSASGETAGYVSNGCVDADIITQAGQAMKSSDIVRLTYGEGSPFKDITLPCGGRIDVLIVPNPPKDKIARAAEKLESRQSAILTLAGEQMSYIPKLRVRIAGRGEAVKATVRQAQIAGFDVLLQSPDIDVEKGLNVDFQQLKTPTQIVDTPDDPWTAVVLLFHDHDWEPLILERALSGPAFYIGAMGSTRTHAMRRQTLREIGMAEKDIARVRGPIGLVPAMRDANLLAISILAEIVSAAQAAGRL